VIRRTRAARHWRHIGEAAPGRDPEISTIDPPIDDIVATLAVCAYPHPPAGTSSIPLPGPAPARPRLRAAIRPRLRADAPA
jgi:hypothetical protein